MQTLALEWLDAVAALARENPLAASLAGLATALLLWLATRLARTRRKALPPLAYPA